MNLKDGSAPCASAKTIFSIKNLQAHSVWGGGRFLGSELKIYVQCAMYFECTVRKRARLKNYAFSIGWGGGPRFLDKWEVN